MSQEPHYLTPYFIFGILLVVFGAIFRTMFVLFMESLEQDEYLVNEFYYKPPKRMKRRHSR